MLKHNERLAIEGKRAGANRLKLPSSFFLCVAVLLIAGCKESDDDLVPLFGALALSQPAAATGTAVPTCTPTIVAGVPQGCGTLSLTNVVSTLAGSAGMTGSADGTGTAARLNSPYGIAVNGTTLYWSEQSNHTIRKMDLNTSAVTTLAGTAGMSGTTDATGASARFNSPNHMVYDNGSLYVVDRVNNRIRKVDVTTGAVTTFAGSSFGTVDGIGTAARFSQPIGITSDGTNLYVSEQSGHVIRRIEIATANVTTVAGTASSSGTTDGTGAAARFSGPEGMTTDGTNLYILDAFNHSVRKMVIATSEVTTIAGTGGSSGSTDAAGTAARFNVPVGITTDGVNLYITDLGNNTIRQVVIASGETTTLAGSAGSAGSTDATGTAARFDGPFQITTNGTSLFVADGSNHTIRRID